MRIYKEKAIVLHTVKYGESSLVVYLLTRSQGRKTYMVQGARTSTKGKRAKAAMFQPLFPLEFEGMELPNAQMHRLRDIQMAFALCTIPFDVRKSTIALFMAETLYRLVREEEPDEALFDLICESVATLDAMEEGVANFHLWFLVRLSRFLGFLPGNTYRQGDWFDISEGLFVSELPDHQLSLSQHNSAILGAMITASVEELQSIKLSRESRSAFLSALIAYFGYHLDAVNKIRSVQILREIF